MVSIKFTPGLASLEAFSPDGRWRVLFEDEGPAGYLYACDRSLGEDENSIVDSMLIYNTASLDEAGRERLASIQWSRSGQQAVLYLDGLPQAHVDFTRRESFCRSNFPNFMEQTSDLWRGHTHAWDEAAMSRFEADMYE